MRLNIRVKRISQIMAESLRVGFILFLTFVISGMLPMLIQSYAWYDMAQKAGGVENIVEVVTEAPPCKFCKAAAALQEKSEPDPQAPLSGERVEVAKTYAVLLDDELSETSLAKLAALSNCYSVGDDIFPRNLLSAPETPPPEWVVFFS